MNNPIIIGDATFYLGGCLDVMQGIPDNSIDTIITDPPYGLSFMGKKWDYDVPSIELWKECLRILKPGGTALIFAGSRTQHRMAINVEDAGFILKDCVMWLYGSGFPKATDISKQLDKKAGSQRKTTNKNPAHRPNHAKTNSWREAEGRENTPLGAEYLTEPATPEAQLWNGWKSHGLKPAYEPILVVMKPNQGSYAENALNHGVAGLYIDGGRIITDDNLKGGAWCKNGKRKAMPGDERIGKSKGMFQDGKTIKEEFIQPEGRYPANVILDEEAAGMLDKQSGMLNSGSRNTEHAKESENNCMSGKNYERSLPPIEGSSGGASRFFYCAKPTTEERNRGLKELPLKEGPYGKNMSSSDKGTISSSKNPTRNHHPTVKPIKLIEYLCTLTKTPTGGIVLDPFMGSGTTAIACHQTHRNFIGIEKEKEYVDIAVKRYREEVKQMRLCDL